MNAPAPAGGALFHAFLRSCLSEQRSPTDHEINIVAGKIWHDSFARSSGKRWQDLAPGSPDHVAMRNAARMALGACGADADCA